jgi:dipeptidyl aminopeptidase/acylaminoacyl peptidase
MKTTLLCLIAIFLCSPVHAETALPLDLAYTMKTLQYEDQPALSGDGKWVVYGVHIPPKKSAGSEMEMEPRFLPAGTPETYVGSRLFLASIQSGNPIEICPVSGNCWRPSWSRNSSAVAFYSDADGAPQLWIFDLAKQKSRRISDAKIKAKLWMGDEAYWSPDGTKIYVPLTPQSTESNTTTVAESKDDTGIHVYVSEPQKSEATPSAAPQDYTPFFNRENNADLASIDVETGKVQIIVPALTVPRPSCLTISPSGKWLAYLSVYRMEDPASTDAVYDLAVAPSSGGNVRVIAKGIEVNENEYYTLAYRWHPSEDQLVYYKHSAVWRVDLNDPALNSKQVASRLGKLAPFPILFSADGSQLVVGTNPVDRKDYSGKWPTSLAVVTLKNDSGKAITVDPELQYDRVPIAAANVVWQQSKNELVSFWKSPKTAENMIFRSDLQSGKTSLVKKQVGRFTFIGIRSAQNIVGTFEDAATPKDVYQFNAADFSLQKRISNVEPRFQSIKLGSIEFYETSLGSKTAQTAVILPPGAKKGDKLPTLVFHYAGSALSQQADRFLAGSPASVPISVFVTRGYAALLVDLMIGPEGTPGNPMQEMTDAIIPQIQRAAELGYTDIKRVGIIGQSYGGYSTAAIITKTNIFQAAVAIDGMYDLPGTYAWMVQGITPHITWSESGQGRMGTSPWKDLTRYINNSPYYQADKIETPLLLIHGGNDDTCPVQDAEKMFVALKRLNKTAELVVYDKEGHTINNWSLEKAVDATQKILDFFAKYIPVK